MNSSTASETTNTIIVSSEMPPPPTRVSTTATQNTPLLSRHRFPTDSPLARRIVFLLVSLILVNIAIWIATAFAFRSYPTLIGTAALAYTLGLRHAVDADHLAAIDNVTRKLLQSGQRPTTVGLFFSLGHSTIVICASVAIAATATAIKDKFGDLQDLGGLIGTSISATFLFIIGIMNTIVLISVYRSLQTLKRTGTFQEESIDDILNNSGMLGRFFGPVYKFVDKSWKMYPLGVLFGIGFDTSTEVGLLGIAAFQANQGLSIWLILFFPALFTAAMALIDTIDGVLMLGTYTWAYINPIRKLYYNLIVTLLSVLVAFVVGLIELLAIIGDSLDLDGPFWDFVRSLGDNFGTIGYLIIGLFVFTFLIAKVLYKCGGYEQLEHKFEDNNNNREDGTNNSPSELEVDIKIEESGKHGNAIGVPSSSKSTNDKNENATVDITNYHSIDDDKDAVTVIV